MKLPGEFLDAMRKLMDRAEFEQFVHSLDLENYQGLRVNTLKVGTDKFVKMAPFNLEPVPWCAGGFYFTGECNPGKHPYYHAGLYYIQEPSAMLPAEVLGAKPGERVLDLCAAPGGKTIRLATAMKGKGLLVSNDNSSKRAKALVRNIELSGARNTVVTVEDYRVLSDRFKGYFDRILVDAPCSGEGMFRKNGAAVKSWDTYKNESCSHLQYDMLLHADIMLKPGGHIVYSTCTFSPLENECVIARFLENRRGYTLVDIPKVDAIEPGRPEWSLTEQNTIDAGLLRKTARLWPHRVKGEGHFVALLRKEDTSMERAPVPPFKRGTQTKPPEFAAFEKENLKTNFEGRFVQTGTGIYLAPEEMPDLEGLNVAKIGLYLGHVKNGRFQPSHSLVLSLKKDDLENTLDMPAESTEIFRYLRGETLFSSCPDGLLAVCVDGFPVGWAKQTGAMLKNLYPAAWRKLS